MHFLMTGGGGGGLVGAAVGAGIFVGAEVGGAGTVGVGMTEVEVGPGSCEPGSGVAEGFVEMESAAPDPTLDTGWVGSPADGVADSPQSSAAGSLGPLG